jgi:hypothetical protein
MDPERTAADANAARNGRRERGRRDRWAPARDALWSLVDPLLRPGARVAILGAGNGDDLPLSRIASRAASLTLIDIDAPTAEGARRRVRRGLRRRIRVVEHDVTQGAADRIVAAARRGPGDAGPVPDGPLTPDGTAPLPGGRYDLVVGDLFYSQLLYPALLDAGVPLERRRAFLGAHGPALHEAVVARMHASAPTVVHLHDRACWGNGYPQPTALEDVLHAADRDPAAGLALADGLKGPREADPRTALRALGTPVVRTALWHWPFVEGVDYLVVATVAGADPPAATG